MLVQLKGHVLSEMENALRAAGLPADDLHNDLLAFRLDDDCGPVGWAALQKCGDQALLRSVVIIAARRGNGDGTELVRRMIAMAENSGVQRLWLLTETAAPFFEKLGFTRIERSRAPWALQRTSEFRVVCPQAAVCMALDLARSIRGLP